MNTITVQSIYLKYFQTKDLKCSKYYKILDFAKNLRNVRNELSKYVCEHYEDFKGLSQYKFRDKLREIFPDKVSSYFYSQTYIQIHSAYQSKFEAIDRKLTFKKKELIRIEYYKRNTKDHKVGDIKKEVYKSYEDSETRTLSFLAKWNYNSETDVLDYIKIQSESEDEKKSKRFIEILDFINQNDFDSLKEIALNKKKEVYDEYLHPCEFKSLTFDGEIKYYHNEFILMNDTSTRLKTGIDAFIKISLYPKEFITIPVVYADSYHLDISKYQKDKDKRQTFSYRIEFLEDIKEIKIAYGIKYDRTYYIVSDDITYENSYAIDVNSADNLFTGSDGWQFDITRKLVKEVIKLIQEGDRIKYLTKSKTLPVKLQFQIDELKDRIMDQIRRVIVDVCNHIQDLNKKYIVMEDLTGNFGKSRAVTEDKLNYNRMNDNILHLSSMKYEFSHIAQNYGLVVNFVPSPYTSKMCSKCHNIDDKNRNQRDFKCTECDFETHADFNAAMNILEIFVNPDLREKFLKLNKLGFYEPAKKFSTDEVREIYSEYYKL